MGGPSWRAAPSGGLPPRLESGSLYERGAPSAERPRMRQGPLRLPSCCRDPLQATWPVVCSCSVQARLSAPACGLGPTGELARWPCAHGLPASGGLTRRCVLTPRKVVHTAAGHHVWWPLPVSQGQRLALRLSQPPRRTAGRAKSFRGPSCKSPLVSHSAGNDSSLLKN